MNKIILVTGANRGIGLEICGQLSKLGHKVIMGSRNLKKGLKAAKMIAEDIFVSELDVTNEISIQNAVQLIEKEFGHLDVLINNAAINSHANDFLKTDLAEVDKHMKSNFYAPWRLSQAFYSLLQKSKDARIINISSEMGAFGQLKNGGYSEYRLSKTALNGLTILMASELKNSGIKVNAMCPGWVRTDMGGASAPRNVEQGADTAVWLSTTKEIPTGKFFSDRKEINW